MSGTPASVGVGRGFTQTATCRWRTGTGDAAWLEAVEVLCEDVAALSAEALVVSLGLDAAASDPESPLRVSAEGYRRAAEQVSLLGPAVVVQEGGYDLAALGELVVAALGGLRTAS